MVDHSLVFFILSGLQALVFLADEFLFHRMHPRQMPRWERWGHPLDTFFFLLPLASLYFGLEPGWIYWTMVVFSSVFITKDEFIHAQEAKGGELWLHSLLFMLHPLILYFAATPGLAQQTPYQMMLCGIAVVMIYQIVYWNWFHKPKAFV